MFEVHPFIFIELCKHGWDKTRIIKNALPEDAKYVRAHTDDKSGWGAVYIVIESETFDELKEGDLIPLLPHPMFEKILWP